MITNHDMIEPQDDRRHTPGPDSLPLWNESYWFAFYDPAVRLGVMTRIGILANKQQANVWFYISKDGYIVHVGTDLDCPVPSGDIDNLKVRDVTYRCLKPLRTFQLLYTCGDTATDVSWEASHPVYLYPYPPGSTVSQFARHIEQGGRVRGTITLGSENYSIACFGHRDHSWGGERDWTQFTRWHYISGDFENFSFNALWVSLAGGELTAGYVWDGKEIMGVSEVKTHLITDAGGRRQREATVSFLDERQRRHTIAAEVLDVCEVNLGQTNCNDGFARFQKDNQVGYGIVELGFQTAN